MRNSSGRVVTSLIVLAVIAFYWQSAQAQDSAPENSDEQQSDTSPEDQSQSGFHDIVEFGGPEGVGNRLRENDAIRESSYRFEGMQNLLAPYFAWKRRVKEERGVAFGTSLYLLYQKASDSLPGEVDDSLCHIFRYQC